MEMQSVVSSNISSAGFDDKTNTMRIQFTGGGTYEAPAAKTDFDIFMASKSKGIHFNKVFFDLTYSPISKKLAVRIKG